MQTQKQSSSISYGDIYKIGEHILAFGDAQDTELVKRAIGDKKINSVISDIPYGIDFAASKRNFCKITNCLTKTVTINPLKETVYHTPDKFM